MNPTPHIIESALLLLAAFMIGCVIGYYLKRVFKKDSGNAAPAAQVATPPASQAKPVAARTVGGAAMPATAPDTVAAAPSSKRETAKKVAAAPKAAAVEKKPKARKAVSKPAPAKAELELLDAPRGGKPDDLKKIKGIGPKLEGLLNQNGIYHYDQIAGWTRANVTAMDDRLSFKGRIDREKWVPQAKALARGK